MTASSFAGLLLIAAAASPIPHVRDKATDYDSAVTRIQNRQAQDDSIAVGEARSIFMGHGQRTPRVYVLLHGFTDAPTQFDALGARLFTTGDNVFIPRLPHHGERQAPVRALGRVSAGELEAFGDSVIDIATGLGDSVIVVGLSAGGNVAAFVAQRRDDVFRAVLIAPAIAAGRVSDDNDRALVLLGSRLPNITRADRPDSTRPGFIQGLSTRGLAQVLRLGESVRGDAERSPAGAKQIVLLLNENDHTVNNDAAIDLARRWTSGPPLVSVYMFPGVARLPHNVLEVPERGGNPELVLPMIESLARGTQVPSTARYVFLISDWGRPRIR